MTIPKKYRDALAKVERMRAVARAYNQTPKRKASQRAWQRAYEKTPKRRAYMRAYNRTPKAKAQALAYYLRVVKPRRAAARKEASHA